MVPDTANTVGNSSTTGSPTDADSRGPEESAKLLVSGNELSSEGLDELAALLLRLGRPEDGRNNRRSGRE